ncbi:MAG: ATP-binding protein [Gemmatimonadota bacterium]
MSVFTSLEAQLRHENPWWRGPDAVAEDPHLQAFRRGGLAWDPPVLRVLCPSPGRTDLLRGPRQAGKTTTVKRIIEALVRKGETRIVYHSCDLDRDFRVLPEAMATARQLHPDPEGPWYVFLDEVTAVPEWQRGVKFAWDQGMTRRDYLLLTGSSAHDLRRGAERLPGRRGDGKDYLQLPMSFRDFAAAACGVEVPETGLTVEGCLAPEGRKMLAEVNLRADEIRRAWRQYRIFGGFPAAVRGLTAGRRKADPGALRILWDAVAGDVARSSRDPVAALKLLEEVVVSLGSPLKWTDAARSMDVTLPTAKAYTTYLADSFVLLPVYFWDLAGGGLSPRKQRKVYLMDPLLAGIPGMLVPGTRGPAGDGLTESLVAAALFRSSAQSLTQADAVPGSVAYWRSRDGREVDFVVPTQDPPGRLPVEVKGDASSRIGHARRVLRRVFGRGIILSRSHFDWREDGAVIPAPVLLACLAERPTRGDPEGS